MDMTSKLQLTHVKHFVFMYDSTVVDIESVERYYTLNLDIWNWLYDRKCVYKLNFNATMDRVTIDFEDPIIATEFKLRWL